MTLTKEQILNADDLKRKEVDVPEWGGTVLLRELTGRERDSFEEGSLDRKTRDIKMTNMRARLVAMSAIDDVTNRTKAHPVTRRPRLRETMSAASVAAPAP